MKKDGTLGEFVRVMRFLGGRIWPYSIGIIGMTLGSGLLGIVESFVTKYIIDGVTAGNLDLLKKGIVIGLVGIAVRMGTSPFFQYAYNKNAKIGHAEVRKQLFYHKSRLPMAYFENHHSGRFFSDLMYNSLRMCDIYMYRLRRFVAPILLLVCNLVPMLILDFRITAVMIVVNLLSLLINTRFSPKIRSLSAGLSKANAGLSEKMVDLLSGISVLKMFPSKPKLREFREANAGYTRAGEKRLRISALLDSLNFMFDYLNSFAFLIIGSLMVSAGLTSFGTLAAIWLLQRNLSYNFLQAGRYLPEIYDSLACARAVFDFFEETPEKELPPMPQFKPESYIEFRDVTFRYLQHRPVLEHVSFRVEKGCVTALTGASGAGKSTVAKLLLGFYPPESGSVALDGRMLSDYTLKELREMIAYVPQEPFLYADTLYENIRCGRPDATRDEIIEAAKGAHAHAFILEQPNGYETLAGERGERLSFGQRQRIAIARAILKNAPVLLLDEATSALDNESEQQVRAALATLMCGRTTLIIAHRPSTVQSADRVVEVS